MNPTELNAAIAEYLGWKPKREMCPCQSESGCCGWHTSTTPDYCSDLNACHEMMEKFAPDEYWDELARTTGCELLPYAECAPPKAWREFASATARQRCEAFARTVGIWRE